MSTEPTHTTDAANTNRRACPICGEVFPGAHNCDLAREARAMFEAAKHANSAETARALGERAYDLAVQAETSHARA